ncbi:hypothetical protein BH09GEM1_BH09GEM1_34820 [soil metagenome]
MRESRFVPPSFAVVVALSACERAAPTTASSASDELAPYYRNVASVTSYVADSACGSCHMKEAVYRQRARHGAVVSSVNGSDARRNDDEHADPEPDIRVLVRGH